MKLLHSSAVVWTLSMLESKWKLMSRWVKKARRSAWLFECTTLLFHVSGNGFVVCEKLYGNHFQVLTGLLMRHSLKKALTCFPILSVLRTFCCTVFIRAVFFKFSRQGVRGAWGWRRVGCGWRPVRGPCDMGETRSPDIHAVPFTCCRVTTIIMKIIEEENDESTGWMQATRANPLKRY